MKVGVGSVELREAWKWVGTVEVGGGSAAMVISGLIPAGLLCNRAWGGAVRCVRSSGMLKREGNNPGTHLAGGIAHGGCDGRNKGPSLILLLLDGEEELGSAGAFCKGRR